MSKPIHMLVDTGNLFYRAMGYGQSGASEQEVVSMTLAAASSIIANCFDMFGATHTMLAFESYSWRRSAFPEYKVARRQVQMTAKEEKTQKLLYDSIDKFREFVETQTNASPIRANMAEGDDVIARWIELHPDAEHIVVSTDGDMHQLVGPNVSVYSGMSQKCWTHNGILISEETMLKKTPVSFIKWNSRWRFLEKDFDPKWSLYEKIMRGDRSDSIPTAVKPRTRTKLLAEAYTNPEALEKLIDTVREDLPGKPKVGDLIARNTQLVDLSYRPNEVNQSIDAVVKALRERERQVRIGIKYQFFCRDHGMVRAGQLAQKFARPYSNPVYHEETV